jgi:predicted membrane protein
MYNYMDFFPLIALIVMIPVAVTCILSRNFGGIFIPLAILGIVFDTQLGIEQLTPLPILAAAVLLTIGFSVIFQKVPKIGIFGEDFGTVEDGDSSCAVVFGGSTKYFKSDNFEEGSLKCSFGGIEAYFDDVKLSPRGATLHISVQFGGIEIYVPKTWRVQINTTAILGAVEESGKHNPDPDSPTLTIVGTCSFGGVDILYV